MKLPDLTIDVSSPPYFVGSETPPKLRFNQREGDKASWTRISGANPYYP